MSGFKIALALVLSAALCSCIMVPPRGEYGNAGYNAGGYEHEHHEHRDEDRRY